MISRCVSKWAGGLLTCATTAAILAGAMVVTVDSAEARSKRRIHKAPRPAAAASFTAASNYAALVVDAKTGRALFEKNADATRFPASITKVMTLYLVFEDLERGRIRLDSDMTMSARCAAQAPSKLGLRPGQTISVENGIKALVTKSANDVACAFGDNLEGSEAAFADRMTRKARALGMRETVYRNASGLPNPYHVTSARDLVTLGLAIQDRFPRYYGYFGTRVFAYGKQRIGNHNRLLGRVEGVDGIKTGYTNASGFNLLTSVKSGGRSVVAVVMGGRTGASRDSHMQQLIALNLPRASTGARTAPLVAEIGERPAPSRMRTAYVSAGPLPPPAATEPERVAFVTPATAPLPLPAPARAVEPRQDDIAAAPLEGATPKAPLRAASADARPVVASSAPTTTPQALRWVVGNQPATTGSVDRGSIDDAAETDLAVAPAPRRATRLAAAETKIEPRPAPTAEQTPPRKGWIIQIGATTEAAKAKDLLSDAKSKAGRALASAEPFTEVYAKGATTYYRARFAGLNERSADAACKALKRSSVSCFAIKN
ncbi:serine hydrolase [Hansschlegelia sp. KR7-227]|uniref:serine hydrolase n=1 Tax=Hansschlegelia sp. KR7-227 TaxID=3400914 RepID=UPI003C08EDCD